MKKLLVVLSVLVVLSMTVAVSAEELASLEKGDGVSVAEETGTVDEEILELLDPSQGLQRSADEFPECGTVPFSTPCDQCPEACTMNGQEHPCGCETFGTLVRCMCPL